MFKNLPLAILLFLMLSLPALASETNKAALIKLQTEIKQMRQNYEQRIQGLEQRLQAMQSTAIAAEKTVIKESASNMDMASASTQISSTPSSVTGFNNTASPASSTSVSSSANAFNPAISLILAGTYANLSQDPTQFRLQGFIPSGEEAGPGKRSFNLGESELWFSASIAPNLSGQLTLALSSDNTAEVEEGFFQTQGLGKGLSAKAGRFFSEIGYLNKQHSHTWDFVDAPLAYQAFFGGQYKNDGVQFKWLAPTERFFELGLEASNGNTFPGNEQNKNGIGAMTAFAHIGDDIGDSASWRAGFSYIRNSAGNRTYEDSDLSGATVVNGFDGHSQTWVADAVYKWAPHGNATHNSFKLQGEYFHRKEDGTLTYDTLAQSLGTANGRYQSKQSGWYLQGIYQFMPAWRLGLRYDRLSSGTPQIGVVDNAILSAADFSRLTPYQPNRTTLMLDYSSSEFSRFRVQFAQDRSRPEAVDNQIFFQYIMSLGAHGAHSF